MNGSESARSPSPVEGSGDPVGHASVPRTDKLRSYQVVHRAVMPSVEHRQSRYLNRRENSHQPIRHRERTMKRFRTPCGLDPQPHQDQCPRRVIDSTHVTFMPQI